MNSWSDTFSLIALFFRSFIYFDFNWFSFASIHSWYAKSIQLNCVSTAATWATLKFQCCEFPMNAINFYRLKKKIFLLLLSAFLLCRESGSQICKLRRISNRLEKTKKKIEGKWNENKVVFNIGEHTHTFIHHNYVTQTVIRIFYMI